jgi:hypothetical protein
MACGSQAVGKPSDRTVYASVTGKKPIADRRKISRRFFVDPKQAAIFTFCMEKARQALLGEKYKLGDTVQVQVIENPTAAERESVKGKKPLASIKVWVWRNWNQAYAYACYREPKWREARWENHYAGFNERTLRAIYKDVWVEGSWNDDQAISFHRGDDDDNAWDFWVGDLEEGEIESYSVAIY